MSLTVGWTSAARCAADSVPNCCRSAWRTLAGCDSVIQGFSTSTGNVFLSKCIQDLMEPALKEGVPDLTCGTCGSELLRPTGSRGSYSEVTLECI